MQRKMDGSVICGVDEAGRGPVMGPMVVAAVMVESDCHLRKLKVKDSKLLPRQKREEMAPRIREMARVEVVIVSAEEIDQFREDESLNALEARIFASLIEKLSPAKVFVDAADVIEARFQSMIESCMVCRPQMVCEHKADVKYPVVSAASVIAKTTRDALIDDIQKEFDVPIGTGYASDPTTYAFLQRWIKDKGDFPPHTRRSWKTAKEIYSLSKVSRLTDWME